MFSRWINLSSLGLFWAEQLLFKDAEMICKEQFFTKNQQKPLGLFFAPLNDDLSAQDCCRELKLVSVEPPWNKNSEYVLKIALQCLWTKRQRKTSRLFRKINVLK